MGIFNILNDLIEDKNIFNIKEIVKFQKELEEGKFILINNNQKHCLNCDGGASCKNVRAYQNGGEKTSPYFSYISCKKIHKKIFMKPYIPNKRENLKGIYIPIECPYADESEGKGKLFYTKCGRKFRKQSNASVTGYEFDRNDAKCKVCPFADKENRTRKGEQITIYECKAGESEPNKNNEYHTSNENNSTGLSIRSIDWNWLEGVRAYADKYDYVASVYYTQDLPDCRKSLSIGFEQNKGGIAAKKHLINKYFGK